MTSAKTTIAAAMTLLAALCLTVVISAQNRSNPVSGAWTFTIQSGQGTGTPTVTFNQQGETLTGHYSSMMFGEADLKGTIKESSIAFTVYAKWQGERQDLIFTGEYDGTKSMKGKYSTDFGDGTFTAVRK